MDKLAFILRYYQKGLFDPQKGLKRFRNRMGLQRESARIRLFRYITAAASVVLILTAGGMLYHLRMNRWEEVSAKVFVLPDQTEVRLQEGAVLSFRPYRFAKQRTVKLAGTAFFVVNHYKDIPFEVHADKSMVKVLGTKFLFNASGNTVYVNEGRVLFSAGAEGLELAKGDYAELKGQVPVLSVPEYPNPSAWATGRLQYNAVPLGLVLKELSSLFGKELTIKSADMPSLTGEFSLSEGLPHILSLIESALDVEIDE